MLAENDFDILTTCGYTSAVIRFFFTKVYQVTLDFDPKLNLNTHPINERKLVS